MYTVGGMFVIDKKLHIIKAHLIQSKAAIITDDGAYTTEKIDGKVEELIAVRCIYARSSGAGT